MLFSNLTDLATANDQVVLSLVMKDGKMTVIVSATNKENTEAALKQPLVLTATPEELDQGFPEAIATFVDVRKSLAEQVAATALILKSATASQAGKASKTLSKSSKGTKTGSASNADDETEGNDNDENLLSVPESGVTAGSEPAPASTSLETNGGTNLLLAFGGD